MTWGNRFRLLIGLVAVVAVVGALTVVFSHRKGETMSTSASVQSLDFTVGSDYAGTVIEQKVAPGDHVKTGDPVAVVQSNTLLEALDNDQTIADSDVYDVHDDGTLTVKSTVDGIVENVDVQQGGYAASGGTIATISGTDGLFVSAEYTLDAKDYERVENGAEVSIEFPNTQSIEGTVDSFDVKTVDGRAQAVVKVTSDELGYGAQDGLVTPGAPVQAEMKLKNDDALAGLIESARGFAGDLIGSFTG
jgi:multidrug resistance efflux pump